MGPTQDGWQGLRSLVATTPSSTGGAAGPGAAEVAYKWTDNAFFKEQHRLIEEGTDHYRGIQGRAHYGYRTRMDEAAFRKELMEGMMEKPMNDTDLQNLFNREINNMLIFLNKNKKERLEAFMGAVNENTHVSGLYYLDVTSMEEGGRKAALLKYQGLSVISEVFQDPDSDIKSYCVNVTPRDLSGGVVHTVVIRSARVPLTPFTNRPFDNGKKLKNETEWHKGTDEVPEAKSSVFEDWMR